jgi:CPA2 family monovalent cation:H+ antiporter-2
MEGNFLQQALIFLTAAVLCVPLAKKLGMGSVLGYLIAGVLIGPYAMGFVGDEGTDIMHAAEFGVVMMLFMIGLELEPAHFWQMRQSIIGLGTMQMGFTMLITGGIAYFALDVNHNASLAACMGLAMSSTAIVLQTLKEKGISGTSGGQASFSVLLFQDIMVIPILALLPLLATAGNLAESGHGHNLLEGLAVWLQTVIILLSIASIYFGGRYLFIPLMRIIAQTRLHEMFTATALLLVIAVSYLMQMVGMSPALGAFLAGVVLANSEFRHELESDLEPFKGLLLGLFFVGVGATMNLRLIGSEPFTIFGIVALVMAIKALVLFVTGKIFGIKHDQNMLFAIILSQVGEFAFVIFSFSSQLQIFDTTTTELLMAVTAVSMSITPILLVIYERILIPYFGVKEQTPEQEADTIDQQHDVIIAGFGHFGSTIGRFLRANHIEATILDNDSDRVDMLRKMGFNVYYGDATRVSLLKAAGAEKARILIAAIDNPEMNLKLIKKVKKHFPNLHVMARARNRFDAYEMIDEHVHHIYRETLYTSVHMAIDVLKQLGFRSYTATRKGFQFIKYDEQALKKLAEHRHNMKDYIINVREQIEQQEKLLQDELHLNLSGDDHSWDSEPIRSAVAGK